MPKLLTTLSVTALLAFATPLLAQTATPTEAPAADAGTTTDAAKPDTALSLGQTSPDGPGTAYVKESIDDWQLECIRVEEGQEEPCQVFQPLLDTEGNQVANIRIFRLPETGEAIAGALVAVPLETLLTAQLTITVDTAKPQLYPFSVCDRLGCYARIGFRKADIAAFKKGAKATITLVPFVAPDQKVALPMSLKGFTASYDKASVVSGQ